METTEFKNFSNKYLDEIDTNYMIPVFDKIKSITKDNINILDVGCGNGLFGSYFCDVASSITGVDASEHALQCAKDRGYQNTYKISDFCTDSLDFPDNSFDFIMCKDVLEHLLDPLHLLLEMKRVLKKGGYLFINVPNHFPLFYRLKFLFTNNIDTQNFFSDSNDWDFPHIRFFKYESLLKKCQENGLLFHSDYCEYFTTYFPKTHKIAFFKKIQDQKAKCCPNNYSLAFPVLFFKN